MPHHETQSIEETTQSETCCCTSDRRNVLQPGPIHLPPQSSSSSRDAPRPGLKRSVKKRSALVLLCSNWQYTKLTHQILKLKLHILRRVPGQRRFRKLSFSFLKLYACNYQYQSRFIASLSNIAGRTLRMRSSTDSLTVSL
jgi:hypothetical protein